MCCSNTHTILYNYTCVYIVFLNLVLYSLTFYVLPSFVIAGTSQLGVPRNWIVQHVQETEGLRQVPPATIVAAISRLEENSLIFAVGLDTYKMVN